MKTIKRKYPTPWSPPYFGYRAMIEGNNICIIAKTKAALRKIHGRLLPLQPFDAKLCHPAAIRRLK